MQTILTLSKITRKTLVEFRERPGFPSCKKSRRYEFVCSRRLDGGTRKMHGGMLSLLNADPALKQDDG